MNSKSTSFQADDMSVCRAGVKRPYVRPLSAIIRMEQGMLLAGSPPVNTGPTVIPPDEDNEDTELVGNAKAFDLFSDWDD